MKLRAIFKQLRMYYKYKVIRKKCVPGSSFCGMELWVDHKDTGCWVVQWPEGKRIPAKIERHAWI